MWAWFLELHATRQPGFGLSPISFQEIDAWAHMTKTQITPRQVLTLRRMDEVALKILRAGGGPRARQIAATDVRGLEAAFSNLGRK